MPQLPGLPTVRLPGSLPGVGGGAGGYTPRLPSAKSPGMGKALPGRVSVKGISGKAPTPYGYQVNVQAKTNMGGVWNAVWAASSSMMKIYASMVAEYMKDNVAPGHGPGPHPHKQPKRKDMGWLMRSITVRQAKRGAGIEGPAWFAGVFSDKKVAAPAGRKRGATQPWQYGFFLEFGWRSRGGKFFKYPWVAPAYKAASKYRIGRIQGPSGIYISVR